MILVFGSLNMGLVMTVPVLPKPGETVLCPGYTLKPGGKGNNQAVAAARPRPLRHERVPRVDANAGVRPIGGRDARGGGQGGAAGGAALPEAKRNDPEIGYFARKALRNLDDLRTVHDRLDFPVPTEGGGSLRVEVEWNKTTESGGATFKATGTVGDAHDVPRTGPPVREGGERAVGAAIEALDDAKHLLRFIGRERHQLLFFFGVLRSRRTTAASRSATTTSTRP